MVKIQALKFVPGVNWLAALKRAQHGILHQIVGAVAIARQRAREGSQMGQTGQDVVIDAGAQNITVRSC